MQYNEEDVVDEEDEDAEEGVQWPQDRHNEYQDGLVKRVASGRVNTKVYIARWCDDKWHW